MQVHLRQGVLGAIQRHGIAAGPFDLQGVARIARDEQRRMVVEFRARFIQRA